MTPIPKKLKDELLADPFYGVCARAGYHGHVCDGRITFEHSLIYAGKQLQTRYAIVPLCAKAHSVDFHQDGGDLNKEINQWIALSRATPEEIRSISKAVNYSFQKTRLENKHGVYEESVALRSYASPSKNLASDINPKKYTWYGISEERKEKIQKILAQEKKDTGSTRSMFEFLNNFIDEYELVESEEVKVR